MENGAGKPSLLRIMAGVDKDSWARRSRPAGLKSGYLPQEPLLDPAKDVRGNVEEGVAETRALRTSTAPARLSRRDKIVYVGRGPVRMMVVLLLRHQITLTGVACRPRA